MALINSRPAGLAGREPDRMGGTMSALNEYNVVINGWPTTVQLSDDDARARGLLTDEQPKVRSAAAKSRRPANKARTVADKGA